MKLSIKEATEKYTPIVKDTGIFELVEIVDINHKPHPFTIGPRHVEHAADHHCGMLGEATLKAIPCAVSGCILSPEQHTSDRVMALKLVANTDKKTAGEKLELVAVAGMGEDGIDGFIFIKSEFEFTEVNHGDLY